MQEIQLVGNRYRSWTAKTNDRLKCGGGIVNDNIGAIGPSRGLQVRFCPRKVSKPLELEDRISPKVLLLWRWREAS